jgi:outer membrane protein assembly factor BamA
MTRNYREEFQQETASKSKKAILFGFIALFSLCLMAWNSTEAAIAGDIEVHGLYSVEKDEFIDLLGFKQGVQLDKEIVREGIKRAFLKGIFEDISVEVSEGATHDIVVNVREKEFIKKVHIDGNFRISRKKIAELFLLKEDQVMRYDLIPRAKEELKENFSLYGFLTR